MQNKIKILFNECFTNYLSYKKKINHVREIKKVYHETNVLVK